MRGLLVGTPFALYANYMARSRGVGHCYRSLRGGRLQVHRREVNAMVAQSLEPVPRTVAEFPLIRPWQILRQHLTWLDGAEETSFTRRDGISWLQFDYCFYSFQLYEHGTRVELSVADAACPYRIVNEVKEHFSALLSP